MANKSRSYPENVPGEFFVDDTCIDCDLCRQIAPSIYKDAGGHSAVYQQPLAGAETLRGAMALVACPTGSIGTTGKIDTRSAMDAFPERIEEEVYFCGFASPDSYGAASYVIRRPEGNVLVDSPRFASQLVKKLEQMGGVATMFITHRDDVADHDKYHQHFGCKRIIHEADARAVSAEHVLQGRESVPLDGELLAIPVPGHTRGHVVLLYKNRFLFTGDHLAWSEKRAALIAFKDATWYSWREQTQSMKRLLDIQFEWVLPGHGRRYHQPANLMREKLVQCIEWMSTLS